MEDHDMPTETLFVVTGVLAAFAFFSAIVIFGDMTWNRTKGAGGKKLG